MIPIQRANSSSNNDGLSLTLLTFLSTTILAQVAMAQVEPVDDPLVDKLEEIIVEDEGEPETVLPLGTGISGGTLRTAPGSAGDPVRTLQSLPGLAFANDEDAQPAVRGSRPGDNYFQSDFAPSSYLFHLGGALSVFNADLVESFDIYPSAYGPEFSGVTGGVFDVHLREPKTDRIRSTVDISLLQVGALVEGPISENQSFYLAGRISYLDLFLADQIPEEDGVKIVEFPKYTDYQGKYVWLPESLGKVTVQFNGATDTAEIRIAEDSEEIDTDPILAGVTAFESAFHEQAIRWEYPVTDRLETHTLFSHGYSSETGKFGGVGTIDLNSDSYLLKSHAKYSLNANHDLHFGAQYLHEEVDLELSASLPNCGELDPGCFFTGQERLESNRTFDYDEIKAFVKDSWYVTDKLTLYPGLSFHRENLLDKQFIEPRLAMEYFLNDDTVISAGVGQYQQAPDFLQSDEVFGNPSLSYLDSRHAQIGIQRFFGDGWSVKSELYYKALDNLIVSDEEEQYTNEAEGDAYGLDTLIRKDLTNKLSGWAAISLSQVNRTDKRTGEEYDFYFDQPFNVSVVGKYKLNNLWSFGAKVWAHSGALYTPIVGANEDPERPGFYLPEYGKLNSKRFPMYQRVDLRVDRTFQRKKGNSTVAYVELLNVLGKENPAGYDYNADYTEKEIVPQLTGIFSFGIKATF